MSDRPHLLIVDDEPLFLRTTAELLRNSGYHCSCAADGVAGREIWAREAIDLVLTDLNMPGNQNLEFLRAGRGSWPETPVIVITGVPTLPSAIESLRLGIADYLLKPVRYDDLMSSVRRALQRRHRHPPVAPPPGDVSGLPPILGESPAMQSLFELIERLSSSDVNVLITGESGTGKEVVAENLHRRSSRRDAPFQVIDCTAIPESLFESTLFGHAKGAFTGAIRDYAGLLQEADGGTVFFDEIGELPLVLQAKLLRVIQQPSFTPLGKTEPCQVDVRFMCATNRDLRLEVAEGRFRRDLFYRLAVVHLELPPLRARGDDIRLLAQHFLQVHRRPDQAEVSVSPSALAVLQQHPWPGNVRELRNAVEHGLALVRGVSIEPEHLPVSIREPFSDAAAALSTGSALSRADAVSGAERAYFEEVLRQHRGNVAESARAAGMSRQGLHKLLKKLGIDAAQYRGSPAAQGFEF